MSKTSYIGITALLVLFACVLAFYGVGKRGGRPNTDLPQQHGSGYWKSFQKPDETSLRATLSPLQYKVTQEDGTERPFDNWYWDSHEEGIYVDIVSGEPLFSSADKFDSGTGWPSFTKPISENAVVLRSDESLGTVRTEVRSKLADSHLGHVFDDGPAPLLTRYCMNSAALRFIPKEMMEQEGYGEYLSIFAGLVR